MKTAVDVRDRNDLGTLLMKEQGKVGSDVAETLDDDASALDRDAGVAAVTLHDDHGTTAGSFFAAQRTAQRNRLAGNCGWCVPVLRRVFVQHPRHHLRVGIHVGCGNVAIWTEEKRNAASELSRDGFQLALREVARPDLNAALRSPERDVEQRRLPSHGSRQPQHFLFVGFGVVAHPALAWSSGSVVLNAIAAEDLEPAIVHTHRHFDGNGAKRRFQQHLH